MKTENLDSPTPNPACFVSLHLSLREEPDDEEDEGDADQEDDDAEDEGDGYSE
jgi:hypothetical protein